MAFMCLNTDLKAFSKGQKEEEIVKNAGSSLGELPGPEV